MDDLARVQSSESSPTVYGEGSPREEKQGEKAEQSAEEAEKQDARELEHALDAEEGHDTENTGQALGGKLDQRTDEWRDDTGEDIPIRNRWGTVRYALREPMAEFLGMCCSKVWSRVFAHQLLCCRDSRSCRPRQRM